MLVANGNTIGINLISILSKLTNDWIVQGLLEGVLFRGAVSIGEIVFDNNNTFIGPAIAEVARAYEQPQLPGIVFTPSLSIMLDKAKLVQEIWEKDNYFIDKHLIKLDLPAKNQKGEEVNLSNTWFTRWPRTMEDWILQKPEFPYRSTRIFMKQLLNKTDTYQQAPSKARNTMTFIETALEEQFDSKTKSLTAI